MKFYDIKTENLILKTKNINFEYFDIKKPKFWSEMTFFDIKTENVWSEVLKIKNLTNFDLKKSKFWSEMTCFDI